MAGHSGSEDKKTGNLAQKFKSLHEFVGDWKVTQRIWSGPGAEPAAHHGKTKCTSLIGGAAILMVTEIETSGFKGATLITYSPKQEQFELAFLDSLSEQGITVMHGQQTQIRSPEALRARYGKLATQEREWSLGGGGTSAALALQSDADAVAACLPDATAAFSSLKATSSSGSFRMVENKISDDHWVLQFFLGGPSGEFLAQENSFTR